MLTRHVGRVQQVLPPVFQPQADRFIKRAAITFARTESLHRCPPDLFLRCVIEAAELGLPIDGRLCYVVNYKGTYQVMPSYKGLVAVAKRSKLVDDVQTDIVCEHDEFLFARENGKDFIRHVPNFNNRGKVIAAYCVLTLPGGIIRVTVMDRNELQKIQAMAPSKSGPWATWTEEMQKKTVCKRALKTFVDDPGIADLLGADDDATELVVLQQPALPTGKIDLRASSVALPATPELESPVDKLFDEPESGPHSERA